MLHRWLFLAGLLACVACDDAPTTQDPDPLDTGADLGTTDGGSDAGRDDATVDDIDLGATDMAVPDADLTDALCPPLVPTASPPRGVLADAILREAVALGGPLAPGTLQSRDLDGDGALDLVLARGGRLEAHGADGALRWISPVLGLDRVVGIDDLDGDGRLEVVAVSARTLAVFDGLTGTLAFQLPDAPIAGQAPWSTIQTTALVDVDLDGRTDLYVTDGGCTNEGTGQGALLRFLGSVEGAPTVTPMTGPRVNGRCSRWHSFGDVDGDALPDLLVNDARGLNVFDPRTGERRWCAALPQAQAGSVPHRALQATGRPGLEVLAITPAGAHLLEPSDVRRDDCGDAPTLAPRWTVEGADFSTDVAGLIELEAPAIALTQFFDEAWRVRFVTTDSGETVRELPDTRLLAMADLDGDATPELVVLRPNADGLYEDLDVLQWRAGQLQSVLDAPLQRAELITLHPLRAAADATGDFVRPAVVRTGPNAARIALKQDVDGDDTPDRLLLVGVDGLAERALAGSPGAAWVSCDPTACDQRDVLTLALVSAEIAVFDDALTLTNGDAERAQLIAPTGRVALTAANDGGQRRLVARTAHGVVGAVDAERPDAPLRWATTVGGGFRTFRAPFVAEFAEDTVLAMPASHFGPTSWTGLDLADGAQLWVHTLDPARYRTIGRGLLTDTPDGPILIRMDLIRDGADVGPQLGCPVTYEGDPAEPEARCEGSVVLPRSFIGLDPATGQCLWQTILRPHDNCTGPGNQRLSAADTDGDGWPELWASETNALRRFDPATGMLTGTIDLGYVAEGGAGRGGGAVLAGHPDAPVIHYAGNTPIDAWTSAHGFAWRVPAPDDLRDQSWTGRQAITASDEVWVSPGTGRPLNRYNQRDGALLGRIGLQDGALLPDAPGEPGLANVQEMALRAGLALDGGPAILVTTDEPYLYALNLDGSLAWSRQLPALPGLPLVDDVDLDGLNEVVVPLADGRVLIGDEPGPAPPSVVFDRPCPAARLCGPDDQADLDQISDREHLCAAWNPVADIGGYEARVITRTGAALTPWLDAAEPYAQLEGLNLVPGVRYLVEVRTWRAGALGRERSATTLSNGVRIIDGVSPTVSLALDPPETPVGVGSSFHVEATDDDRIAGRRLEIIDAQAAVVWVADIEQAVDPTWEVEIRWPGVDQAQRPVPAGGYRVIVRVEDRAGNANTAEAVLTVCDGPCL
jgi:hypothetical protein